MVNSKTILDFSEENIKLQQMYCRKIAMHYEEYSSDIRQFIFSAFFSPDIWEDAPKVYEETVTSISFLDDEIPLIFLGGRSQNKITRKNQPVGFFVTDHTIYVLEASMFSDTLPKKIPYDFSIEEATKAINKAINSFDWDYLQPILPINGKEELKQLILESVTDILTLKKDLNIEHLEVKKSNNLKGRLIDLGLMNDSCIKIGDYDKYKKHFKKIHKKFIIPDSERIQFAVTDSTLAGPYGMVITECNVYSKDLMEKPDNTKRTDIPNNYPVTIIESSIRLGDNIIHILPSSIDDKDKLKQIIVELLNEEITM
ncbi:hypothetical protein [Enterococcus alishanensis]